MNSRTNKLNKYKKWFLAAAIYNLLWGSLTILFPNFLFQMLGISISFNQALWQVTGMFVLIYAPAYWWASKDPGHHRHLILIAFIGKICGPIGFAFSAYLGHLPINFGWIIFTNDLIWWPIFLLYFIDITKLYGGIKPLLLGK